MNFFAWVREGVKQSVMLGFADAVEAIGTPEESRAHHEQLLENLRGGTAALAAPASTGNRATQARKRLGRSLSHLRPHEGESE